MTGRTFALNDEEIMLAEKLLARLEPGFLPYPLFLQVYRLTPAPVLQIIPLHRTAQGDVEVLLTQRPTDDPLWPNMWHNPGTVIRVHDTLERAMRRLLADDLGGGSYVHEPVFVGNLFHQSDRGSEVMQLYWVEIVGPALAGRFWPVNELPDNIITSEVSIIDKAVAHYLKDQ